MRSRTKKALWVGIPAITAILAFGFVFIGNRMMVSAYCQWGITCIIASYAEEHDGIPPSKWDDLVGYEYHTPYLPEPRTIDHASSYVSVNFDALADFQAGRTAHLPKNVVHTKHPFSASWIDPRTELERYFRTKVRPHGSYDRQYAATIRQYLDKSPPD